MSSPRNGGGGSGMVQLRGPTRKPACHMLRATYRLQEGVLQICVTKRKIRPTLSQIGESGDSIDGQVRTSARGSTKGRLENPRALT